MQTASILQVYKSVASATFMGGYWFQTIPFVWNDILKINNTSYSYSLLLLARKEIGNNNALSEVYAKKKKKSFLIKN